MEILPGPIVEKEQVLVAPDLDGKHSELTGEDMEGREVIRGRIARLLRCKMALSYDALLYTVMRTMKETQKNLCLA